MEKSFIKLSPEEERIGSLLVQSAFTVHKHLGPGLLEKVYEHCLAYELKANGLHITRQVSIPLRYKELEFEEGLRLDILIENKVICEVKSIEVVNPVWDAQVLSQLRLMDLKLGYLINFNVPLIKQGIRRFRL